MKHQVIHPLIGISANILMIESGSYLGRERTQVVHDYVCAIEEAGGIPLVLPVVADKRSVKQQLMAVDGLLLSGGQDVHPLHYQEEPQRELGQVHLQRDVYELELIEQAMRQNKPILGICRGQQLLNVAFGGSLLQDIAQAHPTALQHHQCAKPESGSHYVDVVEGTLLHAIVEEVRLLTNSFHHQAIKEIAPGFVVNAWTKDGIIEGIEKKGKDFVLGVQWHPELMTAKNVPMQKLFQAFVTAARKSRKG